MLNNKGQSLILFIIIMPILLLIMILIVDIGRVYVLKNELQNISNIVVDYGLDNIDSIDLEEKMLELVTINKNNVLYVDIDINDRVIYLTLKDNVSGILSSVIGKSIFEVNVSYMGYMDDGNKRIERVVGD